MHEHASARNTLAQMIGDGDLEGLLHEAEALHGHRCPMLALGVKAGQYAINYLYPPHHTHGHGQSHGHGHGHSHGPGPGEVVALLEGVNCFVDGIQLVTGCTLGNNGLVVQDLGKTAVTVARRLDGAAVRLAVRADFREQMLARYPAAAPLFEKVVLRQEAAPEERHRFQHLWEAIARRELAVPLEEQFVVQHLTIKPPDTRPNMATVVCSRCGEGVLAAKAKLKDGQNLCPGCAGESYLLLSGRGFESCAG
ncbi:MAG: FmdE family protein [Syntrophales bacterium]|nr:FmdE family protein [Syntrophales bacterium]